MIKLLVFIGAANACSAYCQAQHVKKDINLSAPLALHDAKFHVYQDSVVKADLPTQQDSHYDSPENVLRAELSSNSMEWLDEIYLPGGNDATPQDIVEKNESLKFLSCKLLHKLTFISHDGEPYCLLRGTILYGATPFFGVCITYKHVNGRWYRVPTSEHLQAIRNVVWYTKTEKLKFLLEGRSTGTIVLDEVVVKTWTDFGFDAYKFLQLLEEWEQSAQEEKLNAFLDR